MAAGGIATSPLSSAGSAAGCFPKNWHFSNGSPSTHFLSTETRQSRFEQIISAAGVADIGLLEPQEELFAIEQLRKPQRREARIRGEIAQRRPVRRPRVGGACFDTLV